MRNLRAQDHVSVCRPPLSLATKIYCPSLACLGWISNKGTFTLPPLLLGHHHNWIVANWFLCDNGVMLVQSCWREQRLLGLHLYIFISACLYFIFIWTRMHQWIYINETNTALYYVCYIIWTFVTHCLDKQRW